MGDEIIFYNGFNLLVDLIVGVVVGMLVYRAAKNHFYFEGINKAMKMIDDGVLFKSECEGEVKWTFDPSQCQCDCCTPTPDNVTQLFSSREAD